MQVPSATAYSSEQTARKDAAKLIEQAWKCAVHQGICFVPRVASSELRSQMLRPGAKVPSPSVSETVGFECVVHDDSDDLSAQEVEVIRSKEQVEAVMSETA